MGRALDDQKSGACQGEPCRRISWEELTEGTLLFLLSPPGPLPLISAAILLPEEFLIPLLFSNPNPFLEAHLSILTFSKELLLSGREKQKKLITEKCF